jgi:hypothetical protein
MTITDDHAIRLGIFGCKQGSSRSLIRNSPCELLESTARVVKEMRCLDVRGPRMKSEPIMILRNIPIGTGMKRERCRKN